MVLVVLWVAVVVAVAAVAVLVLLFELGDGDNSALSLCVGEPSGMGDDSCGAGYAVNWTTLCDLRKAVCDAGWPVAKSPLMSSSSSSSASKALRSPLAFGKWPRRSSMSQLRKPWPLLAVLLSCCCCCG